MKQRQCLTAILVIAVLMTAASAGRAEQDSSTPGTGTRAERAMGRWLALDADGDGKLARHEVRGPLKTYFERNDTNNNGFLERSELEALAKRLFPGRGREVASNNRGRPNTAQRHRRRAGMPQDVIDKIIPRGVSFVPDIEYREGNEAWKLDLAMPTERGSEPRPAIVFIHGGGWVSGDKRDAKFIRPALEFAAKGYVTISINYRLDNRKTPCVEDAKSAVRWLRAHADQYNVDPNRIGAYGNSAGAHLALMLGVCPVSAGLEGDGPWLEHSSMVQAVVGSATPTRPRIPGASEEEQKKIQPMSYVSADIPPILLIHGDTDRVVPIANADDFVAAASKAGAADVEYLRFTDGPGHGVFNQRIGETGPAREAFFERTLKTIER